MGEEPGPASGPGDDAGPGGAGGGAAGADDDRDAAERLSPEAAFALLGSDLRLAIIRALGEAEGPLSFSSLRERVGERDSGRFNYHLGQLVDHFVRRADGDAGEAGYELTLAGSRVVGAVLEGTYTASAAFEPIEVGEPCPLCGGSILAEYADERVVVHCVDCGDLTNQFSFPPGTIGQFEREELPEAFDRWLRTTIPRLVGRFCLNCSGRLDATLETDDDPEATVVRFDCPRCGSTARVSPSVVVLYHPAGVAFCYDHGLAVTEEPTWRVTPRVEETMEVVATDPPRLRLTAAMDGERLVAEVDASAAVVAVRREPVPDG